MLTMRLPKADERKNDHLHDAAVLPQRVCASGKVFNCADKAALAQRPQNTSMGRASSVGDVLRRWATPLLAAAPSIVLSLSVLSSDSKASALPVAPTYRLGKHLVHAPLASFATDAPSALFVTATENSLTAALRSDGWSALAEEQAPLLQSHALTYVQSVDQAVGQSVGGQAPAERHARHLAQMRIVAWPLGDNPDGPGKIWFVRLLHAQPPTVRALDQTRALAQAESDTTLRKIFMTGTSRLAVAAPTAANQRPLAWVRLRHATGELKLLRTEARTAACVGKEGLTSLDQGQGAAAPTTAGEDEGESVGAPTPALPGQQAPGSAAGPACEARGALPFQPLANAQLADAAVWHVATKAKQVALTFDACSTFAVGRFNPRVIAALRAHGVPSTLFVGGHWAEMYPEVLEDLAQDPLFELGNHTYSHPHMRDLSPAEQAQELLWTQELIFERTGKVPRLFRPPYGEVDDQLITTAAGSGLYTVEYDLPAGDADDHVTEARLTRWIVGRSNPGSIVVMHMCRPNNHTADALPAIVGKLRAQGFVFCQLSDMLFSGGSKCR